jgi:hypothetical protein
MLEMSIKLPTFSILRPNKIYQNWEFGFENVPSGNPTVLDYFSSGGIF